MFTFDHCSQYRQSSRNGNTTIISNHRKNSFTLITVAFSKERTQTYSCSELLNSWQLWSDYRKELSCVLQELVYMVTCSNRKALLNFSPFAYLRKYWPRISGEAQRGLAKFHAACEECLRLQSSRRVRRLDALPAGCQSGPCTAPPAPCSSSPRQEH